VQEAQLLDQAAPKAHVLEARRAVTRLNHRAETEMRKACRCPVEDRGIGIGDP
jgi:hypothetical protein